MADAQLYDETFSITSMDSSKYDRVARVFCTSASRDTSMTLDINTEVYPCSPGETIQVVLASTLSLDGQKDERGWKDLARTGENTLADMYDYVCWGKIYRFEEGSSENVKVYVSFGGLLLFLDGPYKKMTSLRVEYVYLLVKK